MGKVAFASFIGTAIEFYDFYIYGTAAALVLAGAFFPEFSETAGTLAAYATFAVAFFARPVGGVVFGHFGNHVGRKAMLIFSLLLMGVATFLIGLLPGYAAIGIWAPVLLVALRSLQGLGLGGEWGGAVLMATEHAAAGRRAGLWAFPLFWLINTRNPFLIALSQRSRRQLQPGRRLRRRLRAPDRGPVAGIYGGFLVYIPLRPGDSRRELRLYLAALGDLPDGPLGDPGRGTSPRRRGQGAGSALRGRGV